MLETSISPAFIQHACEILAHTSHGLSGPQIVKMTASYAVQYGVEIPHPTYPFGAPNKRSGLYDNLMAFLPSQQYLIIRELCDYAGVGAAPEAERKKLKLQLIQRYSHLAPKSGASDISDTLIEQTRHWLDDYPDALGLYNAALSKYEHGAFHRNLLDDLRLALEKLLRAVLGNGKSLENQTSAIGAYIKDRGGSKELANMFMKLLDYYASYQNSYVKHDDAVIEEEIEFVFEITSSFMKHLIRLGTR